MSKPRGPEPTAIHLSTRQRAILEEIVNSRASPQYEALRARIILEADLNARNQHIADKLNLSMQTVSVWRLRWANAAEQIGEVEFEDDDRSLRCFIKTILKDAPRSGCPPIFTPEQICRIVALACESPNDSNRAVCNLTPRELADEAVKQGIVAQISPRSVGRFLKYGRSQATHVPILAEQRKR